ncbi:MAG: aldehyde dehydrogenase family protein [Kiloniellales bacterium]
MTAQTEALIDQIRDTGTLEGLPQGHFINGRFRDGGNDTIAYFDPGRGEEIGRLAAGGAGEIDEAVAAARRAFTRSWRHVSPAERGRILHRVAGLVRDQSDLLAVAESLNAGKTLSEARGDVNNVIRTFEFYSGATDKLQGDTFAIDEQVLAYTVFEPIGVTAHIVPWNFPLAMLVRGVAPALAAGCSVVAKPAEQTPVSALLLARIFRDAGLPDGVFNVVTGTGEATGAPLAAHPDIDHVTFTGSVRTGTGVMRAAAGNVTQVTLELGGKSPAVVFADCDIDRAVDSMVGSIFMNAGQICSAASRLVIERAAHGAFLEKLVNRAETLRIGHGLRDPDIGAINSQRQLDRIEAFLTDAKARGVSLATGGSTTADPETGQGWFVEPTVFDNVAADDPLVKEEIFGPVLVTQIFDDEEEAIRLANGTDYGLAAGIFTKDTARARRLSRELDAGQIYINQWFAVGVEVPFGGNRKSGIGREKGIDGMRAYSKIKGVGERF